MKTYKYIFGIICVLSLTLFYSCDDLLDVDSEEFIRAEENELNNPNDSVYSVFGILSQLQDLTQNHLILGELRGDLLDVTPYSGKELLDINTFDIQKDNPYVQLTPYYALINNCNYIIANMDTLIGKKILMPDYVSTVCIRAWAYYQLAINYEYVRFSEKPILNVSEAKKMDNFPKYTREQVFDWLIPQLRAIESQSVSKYAINGVNIKYLVPPAQFLLAEIYLWKGEYQNAATYYKRMIEKDSHYMMTIETGIRFEGSGYLNHWDQTFSSVSGSSSLLGSELNSITLSSGTTSSVYSLKASSLIIDKWKAQEVNSLNSTHITFGDRRGENSSWDLVRINNTNEKFSFPYIHKKTEQRMIMSRGAYFHLRYAEAVNRLGKPTLAMTAINYGLNKTNVNPAPPTVPKVKPSEIQGNPYFVNFENAMYNGCLGLRAHAGLKPVAFPTNLHTLHDSILFVENVILQESALETAFEGNRFTDLVRVALRRDAEGSDSDFLPNTIAQKFVPNSESYVSFTPSANAEEIRTKLRNRKNWFLPVFE